jgi:Nif-specific regulatory protein
MVADSVEAAGILRERDLYRRLLDLGHNEAVEPFVQEALDLIVAVTGAVRGYLELNTGETHGRSGADSVGWFARGCTEEEVLQIRDTFSRGVIAAAIASGRTIVTVSAVADPRFKDRTSVRENRIEALLCAPIGDPPVGVLYLQDRATPGPFTDHDRELVETFARTLALLTDRLLASIRLRDDADPTLVYRRALRADGVVGRGEAMGRLLKAVSIAAPVDLDVLLTGPSGTGKTRVARLVHESSARASGPFVELNCAALNEELFESELFGHRRGAFTGADSEKVGLVRTADGGTLFLDEVGEIPYAAQAKLLKFLDSKEYYQRGGTRPLRADVRIVAATNVDLESAIRRSAFREDLLFRLNVMPIQVPSLAERREDIPDLVRHFCRRAVERFKLRSVEPSAGALRAAEAAEWTGNIRQLENTVQRAAVVASSEMGVQRIERRHLFPEDGASAESTRGATFQDATREFQANLVRRTLEEVDWNVTEAASQLDLTRSHVYNLIKAFGLERRRD